MIIHYASKKLLRIILLITALLLASFMFAQTHPVREITPGVFYYYGDESQKKSANCVWIVFKDYVVVVDANYPWGAEEILQDVKKNY